MTYGHNRGIMKIDCGRHIRLQFSNSNVTEYVYSATDTDMKSAKDDTNLKLIDI